MRTTRLNGALSLGLLVAVVLACSASTANLSSLKLSKDKSGSPEASTFGARDTVYVVGTVSNAPGKVKVKGRLVADGAEGLLPLDTTIDLAGSGTAIFTFTPPPEGWPNGKYKVEVILTDEDGKERDTKTASFSVS
jgi:hypothetical protein